MSRPLLYNFHSHRVPDGIPELLSLLGLWHVWDSKKHAHRIYEDVARPARLRWKMQEFRGGDMKAWQEFLSRITGPEQVL